MARVRAALLVREIASARILHDCCTAIHVKGTVTLVRAAVMYAQALAWQFPRQAFARAPRVGAARGGGNCTPHRTGDQPRTNACRYGVFNESPGAVQEKSGRSRGEALLTRIIRGIAALCGIPA